VSPAFRGEISLLEFSGPTSLASFARLRNNIGPQKRVVSVFTPYSRV
jgi:hypothetical protein